MKLKESLSTTLRVFMIKNLFKLFLLSFVYFTSRFINLTSLPVFGDEAIYVRWSQIIRSVETLRFIPLTDGKQPLFMWLTVPFLKIFSDPLFASRMLSVLSGLTLMLTIVLLLTFLNKKNVKNNYFQIPPHALIAGLIYIFLPFSYFFDRMALADTLLSLFGVTTLFLTILLAYYPRLDISLLLGFSLGLSWLTKSPAIYFTVLSFFTFIFLNRNLKKIYLPIISIILSQVIYSILRLGPQFHQIALRNQDYIWKVSDIIKNPLDPLIPHLTDTFNIYILYISFPLVILFLFLFLKNIKKISAIELVLICWWILPIIANSAFAKVYTARYILYTLPSFIILTSLLISRIKKPWIILFLLIPNIYTIYILNQLPFNFKPTSTEQGYFQDWTSGWGIKPAADYLISRSKVSNVIVGTEGYFGTLPDGLQIYTNNVPQLTVFGVGVDITKVPEKLLDAHRHGDEVYLLINNSRLKLTPDQQYLVKKVLSFPKPDGDSLDLYQLIAKL